ncbi:MAG TPA: HAD family hydrolase [Syntrophales bacterium]|nr:HAD family hydrolase [Syntrophales bacterium]HPQ44300.1 HAD family hydrolase [Syntrophales bacterium]
MIQAVLFDFGQTLVNSADGFRKAEKDAQVRLFSHLGLPSWDTFIATYREVRGEFHAQSIFSRKVIWENVSVRFGLKACGVLYSRWEGEYWKTVIDSTVVFPETISVLKKLSSRCRLGLVSNTQGQDGSAGHRLDLFPDIAQFFDAVVIAGEGEVPPKPDPEPFLRCLTELGVGPEKALFVGDDWRIDICGAKGVGIRPVWLQHRSVHRTLPVVDTSVPIIRDLNPLTEPDAFLDDYKENTV